MFPKAFLFDFDGVVVDSFETHYAAWKRAFKELFQEEIVPFPHKTHAGKAPILIAAYFCSVVEAEERAEELYKLKSKYLHEGIQAPKLLPGVVAMEQLLIEKGGLYGIASNATREFIKNSIAQLELKFPLFLGVEDYTNPKPAPEPYISLATQLGITTKDFKDVWVFEDSITGTSAAVKAGMTAIGILTQYTEKELRAAGSQLVFPTLKEAYFYLKEMEV